MQISLGKNNGLGHLRYIFDVQGTNRSAKGYEVTPRVSAKEHLIFSFALVKLKKD